MSSAKTGMGQLTYGSFYVSSLGFGYVSIQSPTTVFARIADFLPLISTTESVSYILYLMTIITFLGAVQTHGITLAIYGVDGPRQNPKDGYVQIRHTLSIILNEDADEIPVTLCDLASQGLPKSAVSYVHYRLKSGLFASVTSLDERRFLESIVGKNRDYHQVETGIEQCQQLLNLISIRNLPRLLYFFPTYVLSFLTKVSFVILILTILISPVTYPAGLLIFAHAILLFRPLLWKPIPSVRKPGGIKKRHKPVYEEIQEENQA
jgi:hypothetical protein